MNICPKCGREITSTRSRELGIGRGCADHVKVNPVIAEYTPAQLEKAWELLADNGIVLVKNVKNPIFKVASGKGDTVYRTAPQACTCPAGVRGVRCYHKLAVRLLVGA